MRKRILTLLLATLCAATSYGQAMKALMFNSTNGQIVASTGTNVLTFTNALSFGTNAATTRTNLDLGATWLTNTNVTNFRTAIELGATNNVAFRSVRIQEFTTNSAVISFNSGFNGISISSTNGSTGFGFYGDGTLSLSGPIIFGSGPFGVTNAAITRTNLGLGDTFAGQFHADFYDNFARYTNGTSIGTGAVPQFGNSYFLRLGSTNYTNAPKVSNGKLVSTNGQTFYLTSQLNRNVYNFGAVFEFDQINGGNVVTILIQPDDVWIGRVLHVSVSPLELNVDVSTNGVAGFGGTNTIISHNFGSAGAAATNSRQLLIGQIVGDTVKITYGGQTFEGRHAQLTNVAGPYFSFESFYTGNTLTNRIHEVWANSEAMNRVWSQPYSDTLAEAARGYGRFANIAVGDNVQPLASDIGNNKAIFGGDIVVQGAVKGWAGSNSVVRIGAPMVYEKSYAEGNTNTTNLVGLSTFAISANTLTNNGSRWKASYIGSFAENTNNKRVVVSMAGTRLDTGNLTDQGEWTVDVTVYRSTNNSHECLAVFQSDQTTKSSRWVFNNGAGVQFNVGLEAAAASNNEVILRGAWADWYP
jgi:hypothetical protein